MRRKRAVVPLILVLAFFGTALIFVGESTPTAFDLSVLQSVSGLRSQSLSDAAVFLTQLGRTPVALLFSLLVWRRSRTMAIHLAAATLGTEVILEVVKLIIRRPRPSEFLALVDTWGYSFPSGHSAVAAATYATAAILICRSLPRRSHRILVTAAAILTIALVALSRIYLGVHYASDTLGGVLLGTAWAAFLAQHWYDLRSNLQKDPGNELHDHNPRN